MEQPTRDLTQRVVIGVAVGQRRNQHLLRRVVLDQDGHVLDVAAYRLREIVQRLAGRLLEERFIHDGGQWIVIGIEGVGAGERLLGRFLVAEPFHYEREMIDGVTGLGVE